MRISYILFFFLFIFSCDSEPIEPNYENYICYGSSYTQPDCVSEGTCGYCSDVMFNCYTYITEQECSEYITTQDNPFRYRDYEIEWDGPGSWGYSYAEDSCLAECARIQSGIARTCAINDTVMFNPFASPPFCP